MPTQNIELTDGELAANSQPDEALEPKELTPATILPPEETGGEAPVDLTTQAIPDPVDIGSPTNDPAQGVVGPEQTTTTTTAPEADQQDIWATDGQLSTQGLDNLDLNPSGPRGPHGRFNTGLTAAQQAAQAAAAAQAKEEAEAKQIEADIKKAEKDAEHARVREIFTGNLDDPTTYLENQKLLQEYTQENEFLKNEDGSIILDSEGKPIKDTSLAMDPIHYQLEAAQNAALVEAGTITAGEATAAAVANFEKGVQTIGGNAQNLAKINALEPMKAASMAKHLNELLDGMEEGVVPLWARPAVTKVEQALAGRGISASSIGRDSLFNAIITSAMGIAEKDATFEQDANKTVYNAKVQAIFEDTKIAFAEAQFNAKSANDAAQFKANMQHQVNLQDAAQKDAMAKFNATEANRGEQFNAAQANTIAQFNATLDANRDQFNMGNAVQIAAATVNWRRGMNTANTAGQNAVNQANASNAFNLNQQAMSYIGQEMRDEAHWLNSATEAEKLRLHEVDMMILQVEANAASAEGAASENSLLNRAKDRILAGAIDAAFNYFKPDGP